MRPNVNAHNPCNPMPEATSPTEIPVALLSQALEELRAARSNPPAAREAAIRYFKSGLERGYQVEVLLQWLLFWPNDRESVFWQVRFPGNEGRQFIETLKQLSLRDLGLAPKAAPAAGGSSSSPQAGSSGSGAEPQG